MKLTKQTIEALERIKEQEYWLEIHGLLEPLFEDPKLTQNIYTDVFDQIKLFEDK